MSVIVTDPEISRAIMEIVAFPYYYLEEYETFKLYLEEALIYDPNDIYYVKYLILINAITGDFTTASKYLMTIYQIKSKNPFYNIFEHIKSTFNSLVIQFKPDKFVQIINKMLIEPSCVRFFSQRISKIYCDIGYTFTDLGYFEQALEFFQKAIENTKDNDLICSLLNNIGTVFSDLKQLDTALEKFKEAKILNQDNLVTWNNVVKMYQFKGNFLKAKEEYLEAARYFWLHR